MNELVTKLKSIPLGAKVTVTLKGWPSTAKLAATLIEHPKQAEGRWVVRVRFRRQQRLDALTVGVDLLGVREGWG